MRRKSSFGLSVRKAMRFFDKRADQLLGYDIGFYYGLPTGTCVVNDDIIDGDGSIAVGVFNFESDSRFVKADDADIVKTLISLYHGVRRSDVFNMIKEGTCPEELLFAHIAKQGSNQYYLHNKYQYVTDVDAEYNAIMDTYDDLCEIVGEKSAEQFICDYINEQCRTGYYFDYPKLSEGHMIEFTSMTQIEYAFSEAYDLATTLNHDKKTNAFMRDMQQYHEVYLNWFDDSSISLLLDGNGSLRSEFEPVIKSVWFAPNGQKDYMMASLALASDANLQKQYNDEIVNILAPEYVFGDAWTKQVKGFGKNLDFVPEPDKAYDMPFGAYNFC